MKLSEELQMLHDSGDCGTMLKGFAERALELEQELIKYSVRFSRTVYVSQYTSTIVEAHSEEEAEAIGQRMLDRGEVYDWEDSGDCFAPHDEEIDGIEEY